MNRAPSATSRRDQPKAPANSKPKNQSPRSPLKDLNGGVFKSSNSSRSSCSTSTTTSIEAPRGCLRFLISNSSSSSSSSSNSSKTPLHLPQSNSTNPKNPAINKSLFKSCKPMGRRKIGVGGTNSATEQVPKVTRLRLGQSGKKFSSGNAQTPKREMVAAKGHASFGNQCGSGSGRLDQQQEKKERVHVRVCESESGKDFQFTPIGCKMGSACDLECGFDKEVDCNCDGSGNGRDNTPPVEATVSPEIQYGSTVMSANTPICFGAGHVLSGVSDKRKCRPRGVLVVGDNCSGIDGLNISDDALDEIGYVDSDCNVVPPLPAEASMHWLLSPCDEEVDPNGEGEVHASVHLQSPLSCSAGYGTSSNISMDKNTDTISGVPTLTGTCTGSSSLVSPSRRLMFQSLLESPSDNMHCCSSQSPPCATPSDEGLVSQFDDKIYSNLTAQTSPCSFDTLGSENLVQTPESNSSIKRHARLSWFDADDGKHAVESNLVCTVDGQQRTSFSSEGHIFASEQVDSSFEFDYLLKPSSSIVFSQLQHNWNNSCWISDAVVEPQSQLRISWGDGLSSRIFEMDDSDCCRCISDEEDINDQDYSDPASPEPKLPQIHTESFMKIFDVISVGCMNRNDCSPLQREMPCAESISIDGGSLAASGDSGWDMCYKNNLFQVEQ
ncbi:unnamed protein product [Rhodiola kirilowii]